MKFIYELCFMFLYVIKGLHSEEIYREECQVWTNATRLVEREPRLNVTCLRNKDCTGFDCSGTYFYDDLFSSGTAIKRHTCFGVYLHPCNDPGNMTVYIEVKEYGTPYLRTINKSINEIIDGFEEAIPLLQTTTEIDADFSVKYVDRKKYAEIRVRLQPVIHTPISSHKPRDARVELVPDIEVPIPRCNKNVPPITHTPGYNNCPDLSAAAGKGFKHGERKTNVPGTENCTLNTLGTGQCKADQVCVKINGTEDTICDCVGGFYYNEVDDECELLQDVPEGEIFDDGVKTDDSQPSSRGKGKSGTSTWIIVLSAIGGVILVAMVLGFIVWKFRHYRLRLGSSGSASDRNPVLDQENDDDEPLAL